MKGTRVSNVYQQVQTELNELEKETVQIDGKHMKPSQCYRFSLTPVHLLFNTNCPDLLREKVSAIFQKYNLKEEGKGKTFARSTTTKALLRFSS